MRGSPGKIVILTLGLLILGALSGCAVGGWPYSTPTATPVPPTASATAAPTSTPLPPTATTPPKPTDTPRPTATLVPPTATATPKPSATPTAKPAPVVSTYNGPATIGNLIIKGKPETGMVGLSFDAGGRDPGGTATVLDTLKKYDAKATFFLTGEWAEANPALVKRMVAEGHEIANHTYDHPNLPDVADAEIVSQVTRTESVVQKIAGVPLKKYIRPPFGAYDNRVLAVLKGQGYEVIYWTLDSGDWRDDMSVQDVITRVGTKAGAGDIVVAHCYAPKTAQAINAELEQLHKRGLKLGSVSQVLGR